MIRIVVCLFLSSLFHHLNAQETNIDNRVSLPGIYVQQGGGLYTTNYTIKYNGKYKEELSRLEHGSRVTGRGKWIAGKDRIVLTRKVLFIFKGKETVLFIMPDGRLKNASDTNCDNYFKKVGSGG